MPSAAGSTRSLPRPAASLVAVRYARATALAAVLVAALWHLAYDAPAVVANLPDYRTAAGSVAAILGWVAFGAVGAVAAVCVLRGRASWVVTLVGLGILLCGTVAVTLACSRPQLFGSGNWAWGAFGWFAQLLLWRRPVGFLLAALSVNGLAAVAAVAVVQPLGRLELANSIMICYGTAVLQLVFAFGARLLERDVTRAAEAAAAEQAVTTRRLVGEAVHVARQQRYQSSARSAADVLAQLASGTLNPTHEATRRRAAIEAARLRRLIAEHDDVPDPLLHELRASADVAERRGIVVDFAAVGTVPALAPPLRRGLTEAPLHVLAAARSTARITVAANAAEVSVGVVADARGDLLMPSPDTDDIRVEHHREGEHLCLRAVWQAPSPLPSSTTIPSSLRESSPG